VSGGNVVDLAAELHVAFLVELLVELLVGLRGAPVDSLILVVVKRVSLSSHRSFPVETSY
jgi:hypothetical protein